MIHTLSINVISFLIICNQATPVNCFLLPWFIFFIKYITLLSYIFTYGLIYMSPSSFEYKLCKRSNLHYRSVWTHTKKLVSYWFNQIISTQKILSLAKIMKQWKVRGKSPSHQGMAIYESLSKISLFFSLFYLFHFQTAWSPLFI